MLFFRLFVFLYILSLGVASAHAALNFNIKNNGTSYLFVSGTTGNVGIGSVTPGTTLDVQGTVRVSSFILTQSPAAGSILMSNAVGIGSWIPASAVATGGTPAGASGELQYNGGGTFRGAANSAVNTDGNIGLGTVLSTNRLDVQGGVGIGSAYAGYAAAPSNGLLVQGRVGVGTAQATGGALIVSGGNVGIGTGFPNALLAVNGDIKVNNSASGVNSLTIAANSGNITSSGNITLGNTIVSGTGITSNTNMVVSGTSVTGGSNLVLRGGASPSSHLDFYSSSVTSTSDYMMFMVGNVGVGTVCAMRIVNGGRIGMGTSAPSGKLVVVGNVGIGTSSSGNVFTSTQPPAGGMIIEGNVGVGTWVTAAQLTVAGNVTVKGSINDPNDSPTITIAANSVEVDLQ